MRDPAFKTTVLMLDGATAPAGTAKRSFLLTRDDGRQVEATLKSGGLDPLPKVVVDGETILAAPALPGWQMFLAALPLIMIALGGAVGGALGGVGFTLNMMALRLEDYSFGLRIAVVLAMFPLVMAFYLLAVMLLTS
jgi:hypothetical protein